ncbi:MAG: c-type cytochrome [Sediminibacterium sp.]|jgi:cytochrome c
MRKILYTLSTAILLVACGGGATNKTSTTETTTETTTSSETKLSDNPDYTKGLALIAGSDCLTCHKVAEKSIGPAYQDVAAKYENTDDNIEMLAGKIIKGGSGNWGAIPMTAHANLSQEDAEAMVKYILLLKK